MAKCELCGCNYNETEVRDDFEFEVDSDVTYDELYPEGHICAKCALEQYGENLSAGMDIEYALVTGDSPDNRPDDWDGYDD